MREGRKERKRLGNFEVLLPLPHSSSICQHSHALVQAASTRAVHCEASTYTSLLTVVKKHPPLTPPPRSLTVSSGWQSGSALRRLVVAVLDLTVTATGGRATTRRRTRSRSTPLRRTLVPLVPATLPASLSTLTPPLPSLLLPSTTPTPPTLPSSPPPKSAGATSLPVSTYPRRAQRTYLASWKKRYVSWRLLRREER
jgi:hypothetical protein